MPTKASTVQIYAPLLLLASQLVATAAAVVHVAATQNEIVLRLDSLAPNCQVFELEPFQSREAVASADARRLISDRPGTTLAIPRFDNGRDRIYSGFVVAQNNQPLGAVRFVEDWRGVSKHVEDYPVAKSKKGLQVQMVDDAIALGVKHACLNLNIGGIAVLSPAPGDLAWNMDGRVFHFSRHAVEATDRTVKQLSDAGVLVNLILLNYEGRDAALYKVLLHPRYDKACPEHLSAFNTADAEGLAWFKAAIEFLTDRYSTPGYPHGRVAGYIVGNEVNSHWVWSNMGHVSMEDFARDYARTIRVCFTAVRKFSSSARIYLSLEHHWNIHYAALGENQSFAARPFLATFNSIAKSGGNFDWGLAFHPYPENLFDCRTWNDKTATDQDDTPRITFKNIEMLPRFFRQPEMRLASQQAAPLSSPKAVELKPSPGLPRHIILSEQGFHSKPTPESEQQQAAAYCYAWCKIRHLDGIDAFILHRHVDHGAEGGLNLGLWRRNPASASPSEPLSRKPIYEVFKLADTTNWEAAFRFALPIIGIKSWSEISR
jgi:hypothetical protein